MTPLHKDCLQLENHDEGKNSNPMAKEMSWIKTNVKLVMMSQMKPLLT